MTVPTTMAVPRTGPRTRTSPLDGGGVEGCMSASVCGRRGDCKAASGQTGIPSFPNSVWERTGEKLCFESIRGREAELRGPAFPNRVWERGFAVRFFEDLP